MIEKVIECIKAGMTASAGAKHIGISERYYRTLKARAAKQGLSPEHDMTRTVPDGYMVKGVSTYYNKDGKPAAQWVKSSVDAQRQAEMVQEMIKGMVETLPRVDKRKAPRGADSDLLTVYPIGDAHIGMMAWGDECGKDWDMKIAEQVLCDSMAYLVDSAPASRDALIVDLGDFLHSDNMAGVTERSGHVLDMDSRYGKVIRVATKVLRRCIESALLKHRNVYVRCCPGNHNDTGALWLTAAIEATYENEPRVKVLNAPGNFAYHHFGKVLLGMTHGHTAKAERLPAVMAADQAKAWGDSDHRYWLTGHVHHESVKEYPGCIVETHGILPPADSYAHGHAYRSRQQMKAIVYHAKYGEVQRLTVNPEMLK